MTTNPSAVAAKRSRAQRGSPSRNGVARTDAAPARFFALACDYDGTLAQEGRVDEATILALRRVRESGRRLLLVTGRELSDLRTVFDAFDLFDWVVAENGGVLFSPETGEEVAAAGPPPEGFVAGLRKRKVEPLSVGRVLVATWHPNETAVLDVIRDLGLERQVVFNKGAVMVLPSGVNKATGLSLALKRLDMSMHNVAGIGDAENDHAFLDACELSAAVANALPTVKEKVDLVMRRDHGAGVIEFAERLLSDDFRKAGSRLTRHLVTLGTGPSGRPVRVPCFGSNLLFTGSAGSGKSTLAKVFLENLANQGYQFCVVDPEGDYEEFEEGVVLGDRTRPPAVSEVLQVLRDAEDNAVVNMLGMPLEDRPRFFATLLGELLAMRSRTGRPHWIVLDEAHHLLPKDAGPGVLTLPHALTNVVYVTVAPQGMLPAALRIVDQAFAVGAEAGKALAGFAAVSRREPPRAPLRALRPGEALAWRLGGPVQRFKVSDTRFRHRRHRRKYAEGDLGADLSFYFRGREGKLNLKAQNLLIFSQMAAGLDTDTWQFHLKRGDYARWFRDVIKDGELVEQAEALQRRRLPPDESRRLILNAIDKRYTAPASQQAVS